MKEVDEEIGGALVEAQVEGQLPPGYEIYRCVYCNFQFVTDHTECDCEPEWCPNGCEQQEATA